MNIATVISFCSNDARFIEKCCFEALQFSKQVIVVVCSHFFDGTQEDFLRIKAIQNSVKAVTFLEIQYLPDKLYSPYHKVEPTDPDWAKFWAATLRYVGFMYVKKEIENILFLDSDEIVDAKAFKKWLQSFDYNSYEVMRFGSFLYALRANLRTKKAINLPLFVKHKTFKPLVLMNELERIGAFYTHFGSKKESILGIDGLPFVHHYSWVRTKQECEKKTSTWSHRGEENWQEVIERAFSGNLENLFALPYEFVDCEVFYDPFKDLNLTFVGSNEYVKVDLKTFQRKVFEKEFEI